jgi:hypothetical protein
MKNNLIYSLEKLLSAKNKVDRQKTKLSIIMNTAFLARPERVSEIKVLMDKVNSFITSPDEYNTANLIAIKERINNKY